MSDHNDNKKSFNLPAYINTPFFLYQDNRLDKPATLIASFFYSLHTAHMEITASSDYLCQLAGIKKRQFYYILNLLEEYGYIQRKGFTNRKKLFWTYSIKSNITVIESDASALKCTRDQELNTSALECSKLVQSSAVNLCTPVHTYNKDNNKDYKKLTTVNPNPSSSSFFSEKQTQDLLSHKLKNDSRSNELFLENCQFHIENQTNNLSKFQRFTGLKHILIKLYETQECFKASGFAKNEEIDTRIPTQLDFEQYKKCVSGFDWVGKWMQKQKQG